MLWSRDQSSCASNIVSSKVNVWNLALSMRTIHKGLNIHGDIFPDDFHISGGAVCHLTLQINILKLTSF